MRSIEALLSSTGRDDEQLQTARLVRLDPRRRVVICATALPDGLETIVGVGAIDVEAQTPDTLLVHDSLTDGLPELLT